MLGLAIKDELESKMEPLGVNVMESKITMVETLKRFCKVFWRILPGPPAADIIYLYYAGAWTDPIIIIRIAELAILWIIVAIFLVLMVLIWK